MQRFIDVSGLRKIADGFSWIGRAAGVALRSLTAIVPVLGAITSAATIGGMVKLVSSFAQWGNQLRINADQIGTTTDKLQMMQDATTRAGGSAEDMTSTLKELHSISAAAFTGQNNEALAYFNHFGIALRDSNGQLKTATDLLPEVFAALDSLKDPADRARVAAALLGDSQAKLYETYKQSGKSLQQWTAEEEKHQRLNEEQLETLNKYRLAQASLGTTFDQLGRQISVVLARNFTPFMTALDTWTQKNAPEIEKKVDELSKAFGEWLQGINWGEVQDNLKAALSLLDDMLVVVRALAKALDATAFAFGLKDRKFTKADVLQNSPFYAQLTDEQKKMVRAQVGITDQEYQQAQQPQAGVSFTEHPLDWLSNRVLRSGRGNAGASIPTGSGAQPLVDRAWRGPASIQPGAGLDLQRGAAIRDKLAADLNISPDAAAGIVGNFQAESGIKGVDEKNPTVPGSRGGTGWAQWTGPRRVEFENWAKANNLDPKSDAANLGFAEQDFRNRPELLAKLRGLKGADVAGQSGTIVEKDFEGPAVLRPEYRAGLSRQFAGAQAPPQQGPPVAPPAAAPPVNGSVDVAITHRNAPPDSSVTAQGKGSVKVAPLKIEHPQVDMAAA